MRVARVLGVERSFTLFRMTSRSKGAKPIHSRHPKHPCAIVSTASLCILPYTPFTYPALTTVPRTAHGTSREPIPTLRNGDEEQFLDLVRREGAAPIVLTVDKQATDGCSGLSADVRAGLRRQKQSQHLQPDAGGHADSGATGAKRRGHCRHPLQRTYVRADLLK